MSLAESYLISILKADPDVFAAVGDRVGLSYMPEAVELPFLTIEKVTTDVADCLSDASNIEQQFYNLEVVAGTYAECRNLADEVRRTLDAASSGQVTWVRFSGESVEFSHEANRYIMTQDYIVDYRFF